MGALLDLTPSMQWPVPVVAGDLEQRPRPVTVTIEYRIADKDRNAFLKALERVARERRRDGAYAWGIFEDATLPTRFVETFLNDSWMEHMRQHDGVTKADVASQKYLERFLVQPPAISHLITAEKIESVTIARTIRVLLRTRQR